MQIVKLINGEPTLYTMRQLQAEYENASLPREIPESGIESLGVYPIAIVEPKPEIASLSKGYQQMLKKQSGRFVLSWQRYDLPPAEAQQNFERAVQRELDDFARTRGYDGIMSACTYATGGRFQAEGARAVELRDATWDSCYELLSEVMAGQRAMPDSLDDIRDHLPVLTWEA